MSLTNYEEVKNGIKKIVTSLGTVDILVNNAGIAAFGSFNEIWLIGSFI